MKRGDMEKIELKISNTVQIISRSRKVHMPYGQFEIIALHEDKAILKIMGAPNYSLREEDKFEVDYSDLSGLPLSIEILESFGFNKTEDGVYEHGVDSHYDSWKNILEICIKDGEFRLWMEEEGDSYYSYPWVTIYTLHQLQNLFYALTSKLLTTPHSGK